MKFKPRTLSRTVALDLDGLAYCRGEVEQVFDYLTRKTVGVLNPDDPNALSDMFDEDGVRVANARATQQVLIADWFACACQRIRVEDESDSKRYRPHRTDDTIAWYDTNFVRVLIDWDGTRPPVGPCGFVGEIVLTFAVERMLQEGNVDAFRCVVAHELTHVFDAMTWVVPAFQDWDSFCDKVNDLGLEVDTVVRDLGMYWDTLDDYGSPNELTMLKRYWPRHARRWFDAFNASYRKPTRRGRRADR